MGWARLFPAARCIPRGLLGGRLWLWPFRLAQDDFLALRGQDKDLEILRVAGFFDLRHHCEQNDKGGHRAYQRQRLGDPPLHLPI